jgi:uncharacterized protein (TIRG00374 family)
MMTDGSSRLAPSGPNQANQGSRKSTIRRVLLTLAGLLCFGGLLYFGGFESFEKVTHPDYRWLIAAILGTGLMMFIFSVRWGVIVDSLVGHRLTNNLTYFFYSLSSLAIGAIVPHTAGTFIGRAAALKKLESVSLKKSAASILLDKMFDGFFMLMCSWPLMLLLLGKSTVNQVALIIIAEFVIISLLIIVHYTLWLRLLKLIVSLAVQFLSLFPFIKKHGQWEKMEALQHLEEWDLLQKRTVLRAYFLTAAGQVMLAVRAWLAAMVVGLGITPLDTFIAIGLVQASILISFTPGALGFADAAWFVALAGAGVPKDIIAVFLVGFRIIENVAVVVFWLPLYFFKVWGSKKRSPKKGKE